MTTLQIKSWRGQLIGGGGLVHTTANPLSMKILRPKAPAELHEAKAEADQKHEEAKALAIAAFNNWRALMRELQKFNTLIRHSQLTPAGHVQMRELNEKIEAADSAYHEAQEVEDAARLSASKADLQIQSWVWQERERIEDEERAKRRAEKLAAKNGADSSSIASRLRALKKRVSKDDGKD